MSSGSTPIHVVVIVLGDLGRSPRMQYHALSLSQIPEVSKVTLVGYEGEAIISDLIVNSKVREKRLKPINVEFLRSKSSLLHAIVKGILLLLNLVTMILEMSPYDVLLIQNPPCLPVLIAILILNMINVTQVKGEVILDWHNLGFSMFPSYIAHYSSDDHDILPTEPKKQNTLVSLARYMEVKLSHMVVDCHICVSKALKRYLESNCNIRDITVVYDRSLKLHRNSVDLCNEIIDPVKNRHDLILRLDLTDEDLGYTSSVELSKSYKSYIESTVHTGCFLMKNLDCYDESEERKEDIPNDNIPNDLSDMNDTFLYEIRKDKSFLIITSTSWTPDEDFELLLEAMKELDKVLKSSNKSNQQHKQKATLIITGKGPLREQFEKSVSHLEANGQLSWVKIRCMWLTHADYFQLLSSADVGVCLHTSTSGLDLPMKVLDMMGCGLVILAAKYYAINELIQHDENGLLFKNAAELKECILHLMRGSGNLHELPCDRSIRHDQSSGNTLVATKNLTQLQNQVKCQKIETWKENWSNMMQPIMERIITERIARSIPSRDIGVRYFYSLSLISILVLLLAYVSNHML